MGFIEEIENCILSSANAADIPWELIDQILVLPSFSDMKLKQQNPVFHGEGDVYTHTRMVCNELIRMPAFYKLPAIQKTELFLAALLHDIGKVKTTRIEDGEWISPHHGSTGSQIVREFLWKGCGICGTKDLIVFRETVCALIRYHMLPFHLMDQDDPERIVRSVAAVGDLAVDFSWYLLCMLAEADMRGRVADDIPDGLTQVELARLMAAEAECLHGPYHFADNFTKHAYISGRNVLPNQPLYDDTWGEVVMLSGLPGTGKDTWILQHHPDKPVVSLDGLRAELGVKPTDRQGVVIQAGKERARECLRKKQPFIWNATNLTKDTRQKMIGLFKRYGASVRIIYLETDEKTRMERNIRRRDAVPENVAAKMLGKTLLPMPDEAELVEWICV